METANVLNLQIDHEQITSNKHDELISDHPVTQALSLSAHLRQYRHHIFPGLNTQLKGYFASDVNHAANFYQTPPAVIKKPIPCLSTTYVPRQEYPYNDDCVLKLVKEKLAWKKKNKFWKNLARRSLRNSEIISRTQTALNKNERITSLPYIITKLADHAVKNPDENFEGVYNWYYGNAIATADFGGASCLLFAGGKHLHEYCFSLYERSRTSDTLPTVSPKLRMPLAEETPIYDIVPGKEYASVGIRQRNHCYFFMYREDAENISVNSCLRVKKQNYPFVSIDSCESEFCTVDSGRNIRFWTPHTTKDRSGGFTLPSSEESLPDAFIQMKYSSAKNSQQFTVVDRRKLYYYDKRTDTCSPVMIYDPSKSVELCEDISLLVPSVIDNFWYLGLTHSCLLFDIRAGFIQKWTHMLSQPPSVGSTFKINKKTNLPKECFLLGTQSTNEIVAIYNQWKNDKPKCNVLPVNVPIKIDTLHEARCNGLLADPSLTKKFSRSIIGMAPYKKKTRIGVFTLSSTGDIFHQRVHRRDISSPWNPTEETKLEETELNHLKNWQTDYLEDLKERKSDIRVTHQVDMTAVSEIAVYRNPEIPPHPRPDLSGRAVWKKSKAVLESYRDLLAPNILHDFGLDEESEWGSDTEEQPVRTEPSSYGKVTDWLSHMDTDQSQNFVDVDELFKSELQEEDIEDDSDDAISVSSFESVGRVSRFSFSTA